MEYDFKHIESKWQEKWEEEGVFHAVDNSDKPKFYGLVEFPYPSGAGMHVGHIKAYSGLEVVSRKRRLQGYNVLFPIGFDAYGLPCEAVNADKQRHILYTARVFLAQHPTDKYIRFDVIEVYLGKDVRINHIESAFEAR